MFGAVKTSLYQENNTSRKLKSDYKKGAHYNLSDAAKSEAVSNIRKTKNNTGEATVHPFSKIVQARSKNGSLCNLNTLRIAFSFSWEILLSPYLKSLFICKPYERNPIYDCYYKYNYAVAEMLLAM